MSPRFLAPIFSSLLVLIVSVVPWSSARAAACIPGHNTVAPPCTFDNGLLTLSSGTSGDLGGGGHHKLVLFAGSDITIEADIAGGFPAYDSNDNGTGTNSGTFTLTISTTSGAPLIEDYGLSLIDPAVSGTGAVAWSFGALSGDQTVTSGDFLLGAPVSSITETLSVTLTSGASGDASLVGATIDVSLVPEPRSLFLLGAGLLGMAVSRRKR